MSLEHFKKELERLVNLFERNIDEYKDQHSSFNETQLRIQFVDPMFQAMGWDMNNVAGFAEQYKEVVHEDKVLVAGKPKAPDYSFRIGGQRKYFLEAKQPFVKIKTDYDPALQLRRYAWSGSLPISILTDFEEFAVYDTTIRPKIDDNATVSRIEYFTFREYLENAEWIYNTFSKEAIQQGSFDKYTAKEKRGKQVVDKEFLKEIENWREWLAKDIARYNDFLTQDELNQAVQKTIDRILFLRIAEEKGIEPYKTLDNIISYKESYPALIKYFKKAHNRYDSSLFNFEIDQISERITITDKVLDRILQNLYYPKSPYEFSVIGVEILGSIYEQFLGKVITLTKSHNAKIEEKPEVRKAGGIYYTPQYIVNYIVENTVGELVKGKTPKEAAKLKVLDPACGSGSFLIGAYEFLLKWHIDYYNKLSTKEKEKAEKSGEIFVQVIEEDERKIDTIFLSTTLKKQILLNNIYGVDLDNQAVEVTKLSLALKMLENENNETINQQFKMNIGDERILPDMSNNIKCGNSLVGSDYWDDKDLSGITDEEIKRVNAFDWEDEFKEIFKAGGFDAVIGNPPYVQMQKMDRFEREILMENYAGFYKSQIDLWYLFVYRSFRILNSKGLLSFITSNYFLKATHANLLRRFITVNFKIINLIDFGPNKIFDRAGVHTSIITLTKSKSSKDINYQRFESTDTNLENIEFKKINNKTLNEEPWEFIAEGIESQLFNKIYNNSYLLGNISQIGTGVKSGFDKVFVVDTQTINKYKLERGALRKWIKNSEIKRYLVKHTNKYIIYSYKNFLIKSFPNVYNYLYMYKEDLLSKWKKRGEKFNWSELYRAREFLFLERNINIICPYKAKQCDFALNDEDYVGSGDIYVIKPNSEMKILYILGILNSRLGNYIFRKIGKRKGNLIEFYTEPLSKFPIRKVNKLYLIDKMEELVNKQIYLNNKIEFEKDLNKGKIIRNQVVKTDDAINNLIYELYGLTKEEIDIIEKSI